MFKGAEAELTRSLLRTVLCADIIQALRRACTDIIQVHTGLCADIIQALRHALRRYHSGSSGRSMASSLPCRHPARDRQVDGRNRFLLRVG